MFNNSKTGKFGYTHKKKHHAVVKVKDATRYNVVVLKVNIKQKKDKSKNITQNVYIQRKFKQQAKLNIFCSWTSAYMIKYKEKSVNSEHKIQQIGFLGVGSLMWSRIRGALQTQVQLYEAGQRCFKL